MQNKLTCGQIHVLKDGMCNLSVRNKAELANIIVSLNVEKQEDFLQFNIAVLILKINQKKNLGKGLSNLSLEDRQILDLCI